MVQLQVGLVRVLMFNLHSSPFRFFWLVIIGDHGSPSNPFHRFNSKSVLGHQVSLLCSSPHAAPSQKPDATIIDIPYPVPPSVTQCQTTKTLGLPVTKAVAKRAAKCQMLRLKQLTMWANCTAKRKHESHLWGAQIVFPLHVPALEC